MTTSSQHLCPECGTALFRATSREMCPRCLVARAFSVPRPPEGARFLAPTLDELNAIFPDFDVREFIGQGGMGAVYQAWQKSLHRSVALKILPPELLDSEDFFDRFQREARTMAQMDHPNIAKVFETGITGSGEPYMAMELVRGEQITRYAALKSLNLKGRLNLFLQVCAGVQHAHSKGILHRDLQPSNILITDVGGNAVVKIIDFGLAKPLDDAFRDDALWISLGRAVGTPAYMSPEQASSDVNRVDTRSDIYALGVLLYELLAGLLPFDECLAHAASAADIERAIRETPVQPPSECTREISSKALRGDLDAIVLKAVEKDPANRYQTASGLAEDIERHLIHQPVTAVTPAAGYLIGKFVHRHRVGLGLATVVLVAVLAGAGLFVRESMRTREAEQQAEMQLHKGERLIEFMLGDLQVKLESLGRLDVLESTASEVEKFYAESDTNNSSPESLRHRAHALVVLGRIRNSKGDAAGAKERYKESIRLYRAAIAEAATNLVWQEELGQAWNCLAITHHLGNELPAAESAYREALAINAKMLERDPKNPNWIDSRAALLHNLASLYDQMKHLEDAEKAYSEALALWTALLDRLPGNPDLLSHMSVLQESLSYIYGQRHQTNQAERALHEALRLREELVRLDPKDMRWLASLADAQQNLAELCMRKSEIAAALEWIQKYLPIRERLAQLDPNNPGAQNLLADAHRNYAAALVLNGKDETAATEHRKAWEVSEKFLRETDSDAPWRQHWLDGLASADAVFSRLAEREEREQHPAAARDHWFILAEIRGKRAAENLNDTALRHALAAANISLASLLLRLDDQPAAALQCQLALFQLQQSARTGQALTLSDQERKLLETVYRWLRRLPSSAGPADKPARNPHLIRSDIAQLTAALDDKAISLPPPLSDEIRRELGKE